MSSDENQLRPYAVRETGQLTIGDLKVGAGSFHAEDITTDEGEQMAQPVAGLWFFVRNHPDLNHMRWVREGDEAEVANYTIKIDTIQLAEGEGLGMIFLSVQPPAPN